MCGSVQLLFILVNISLFSTTSSLFSTSVRHQRQISSSLCKSSSFRCNNGECIPSFNVCDGAKDCTDTSDETRSLCQNIRCPSLSFKCAYGACIDQDKKCDGSSDCVDGSDEVNCGNSCGVAKFKCNNGECIDLFSTCDGLQDCSDRSDETKDLCKQLTCPNGTFRCDYGACLAKQTRCNGKTDCHDNSDERGCGGSTPSVYPTETIDEVGSCRLPAHPAHGVYHSVCPAGDQRTACRDQPGTPVPNNWLIKYSCNENYDLTSTSAQFSICDAGNWNNPLDCIKLCPPLRSLSVDVHCELDGREVPCDQPMKPNTTASAACKQHYRLHYVPEYSYLICLESGEWSYRLFYCVPDCGVSIKGQFQPLILDGEPTVQGEYPWLVALYGRNNRNKWVQNCAGTLINPHIVLTAAHCLVFTEGVIKPEDIKVGLGKYWRDYDKYENYSLIANVREVIVPQNYAGASTYYALDIGLLDLAQSVLVTAFIMPACVDWGSTYSLTSGEVGHVAGWGTTENNTSSEAVLSANMSYIDNAACVKQVRQVLKRLVTHDKFCAAGTSGGKVDKGDSGGGLTVVKKGQHFVFGVVSTKITEEKELRLFTDITNAQHHVWLNNQRTTLDQYHSDAHP